MFLFFMSFRFERCAVVQLLVFFYCILFISFNFYLSCVFSRIILFYRRFLFGQAFRFGHRRLVLILIFQCWICFYDWTVVYLLTLGVRNRTEGAEWTRKKNDCQFEFYFYYLPAWWSLLFYRHVVSWKRNTCHLTWYNLILEANSFLCLWFSGVHSRRPISLINAFLVMWTRVLAIDI